MTTTDRREIRLSEYSSVTLAREQLSDRDLGLLRGLQKQGRLTVTDKHTHWTLKADATVGVLVLDHTHLTITPKVVFSGKSLIRWLCYAMATPVPHEATTRRWTVDRFGFTGPVAAALLEECRNLLRDGLRRDYNRRDLVSPVLRGRLDFTAQATKRYGMLDQLHIRTFEREIDIWENQVCGIALRRASSMARDAQLARQISSIAKEFPATISPVAALHALSRATYTRLNDRYRPAHTWAGLVLGGGGVNDLLANCGHSADSLLLNMPTLWETAVRRLMLAAAPAGTALASSTGTTGIVTRGDRSPRLPFRPDVLLRLPTTPEPVMFPADAKYKAYGAKSVESADVHQLLTYIAGYSPTHQPTAAIIYPHAGRNTHRTLRVAGNHRQLGAIHTIGINPDAAPDQASAWIRETLWPDNRTAT